MKKTYKLSPNDIATICDVYGGIQFDFPKEKAIKLPERKTIQIEG